MFSLVIKVLLLLCKISTLKTYFYSLRSLVVRHKNFFINVNFIAKGSKSDGYHKFNHKLFFYLWIINGNWR